MSSQNDLGMPPKSVYGGAIHLSREKEFIWREIGNRRNVYMDYNFCSKFNLISGKSFNLCFPRFSDFDQNVLSNETDILVPLKYADKKSPARN